MQQRTLVFKQPIVRDPTDSNRRMLQREREAKERLAKQEAEALATRGTATTGNEGERKARAEQAMRTYFEQTLIDPSSCRVPDDWLLHNRRALLIGREVLRGLLAEFAGRAPTC